MSENEDEMRMKADAVAPAKVPCWDHDLPPPSPSLHPLSLGSFQAALSRFVPELLFCLSPNT